MMKTFALALALVAAAGGARADHTAEDAARTTARLNAILRHADAPRRDKHAARSPGGEKPPAKVAIAAAAASSPRSARAGDDTAGDRLAQVIRIALSPHTWQLEARALPTTPSQIEAHLANLPTTPSQLEAHLAKLPKSPAEVDAHLRRLSRALESPHR